MSKLVEKYRHLEAELNIARISFGENSEMVNELIDQLDEIWFDMTHAEQLEIDPQCPA
jgi:hypothetical protein